MYVNNSWLKKRLSKNAEKLKKKPDRFNKRKKKLNFCDKRQKKLFRGQE